MNSFDQKQEDFENLNSKFRPLLSDFKSYDQKHQEQYKQGSISLTEENFTDQDENRIEKSSLQIVQQKDQSYIEFDQEKIEQNQYQSFDQLIDLLGGFGLFQFLYFSTIVCGMISGAFILYSLYYFEMVSDNYLCQFDDKDIWNACTKQQICNNTQNITAYQPDFSKAAIHNWVEQYDLLCSSDFALSMIGSCFFIGCFFGSFILPRIADIKGRKPMFLLGLFLYIVCVFGLLFSTNKALMYTFLVIGGISETGRYYVAYVYAIEIMPKRLQNVFGLIIFMSFATCKVIICLYFWVSTSKDWGHMAYAAMVLAIFSFIITFILMPESPRFLVSKRRYQEAAEILLKIKVINKCDQNIHITAQSLQFKYQDEQSQSKELKIQNSVTRECESRIDITQVEKEIIEAQNQKVQDSKLEGTVSELCGINQFRQNIVIMTTIWSFGSFAFFLIPFYLTSMKANIYYLSLSTEAAEFLASIICLFIAHVMDLRKALFMCCCIVLAGCLALMIAANVNENVNQDQNDIQDNLLSSALIMLTNLGVVIAFDVAYLINAQLFPTVLLATAYGVCNIMGRSISIFSPIVAKLPHPIPLVALAIFAGVSAFMSLGLVKRNDV